MDPVRAEERRDVGDQQYREGYVGDEAAGQDGVVVDAEGEGVAEVGDHGEPRGPPCPALTVPERDGDQHDEQQPEGQLVQRVSALDRGDVAGDARVRGLCLADLADISPARRASV